MICRTEQDEPGGHQTGVQVSQVQNNSMADRFRFELRKQSRGPREVVNFSPLEILLDSIASAVQCRQYLVFCQYERSVGPMATTAALVMHHSRLRRIRTRSMSLM